MMYRGAQAQTQKCQNQKKKKNEAFVTCYQNKGKTQLYNLDIKRKGEKRLF